jgi:hypothetical protein
VSLAVDPLNAPTSILRVEFIEQVLRKGLLCAPPRAAVRIIPLRKLAWLVGALRGSTAPEWQERVFHFVNLQLRGSGRFLFGNQ